MYVGFWLFAASFQGRTPFISGSEIKVSPLSKSVFFSVKCLFGGFFCCSLGCEAGCQQVSKDTVSLRRTTYTIKHKLEPWHGVRNHTRELMPVLLQPLDVKGW
jgi:hypothetical protein